MKLIKPHPIAELLPRMSEEQFHELVLDVEKNGLMEPIMLHEGKILDGRHRHDACLKAGREPKYVEWNGEHGTPLDFVFAKNFARRHMNESQRAVAAAKLLAYYEAEAKKRQKKGTSAPRGAKGKAAEFAAAKLNSSSRSVERAKRLLKESPEAIEAIDSGKATLGQAEKKIRRAEQLEEIKAYVPPAGKSQVITTDFSWEYVDKLDGSDAVRGGPPYPPMTTAQIVDFVKTKLAPCCDEVCLYGCWVTNTILLDMETWPAVQAAIEGLGFRPVKLNTWRKVEKSGAPFTGLGNGQRNDTEQLVLFARGTVVYNELGEQHGRPLQRTCFDAPVGEHSEKPQLAYDRLEQLVPYTRRLEMFARKQRPGWTTTGSELERPPMFIDTPAGQAAVKAINEGMMKTEPGGAAAELARKDASGLAVKRYPLQWPKARGNDEDPMAIGPSGCVYKITRHRQGLALNTVLQTLPDGKPGSSADLVSISQCELRAEEWEQLQVERMAAEQRAPKPEPKKKRKLSIDDVPPPPEPPVGIEWTVITKKTVVPGLEIEKDKKYHVERGELGVGKRTMYLLGPHGQRASLGIISEDRRGIIWPGGVRTLDEARAAAVEYERTGEIPATPDDDEAERAKPIPADEIRWVKKKHPTKVAVGLARSGRRYAIDKFHKTTATGKKIDGYLYRWFCTSDGASALGDFDTIDRAQANAGAAEQEYQRMKTSAA